MLQQRLADIPIAASVQFCSRHISSLRLSFRQSFPRDMLPISQPLPCLYSYKSLLSLSTIKDAGSFYILGVFPWLIFFRSYISRSYSSSCAWGRMAPCSSVFRKLRERKTSLRHLLHLISIYKPAKDDGAAGYNERDDIPRHR
jgi:hypothetical protein